MRALVISLGSEDHILVLNVHHIVSDGWSMGILLRDLAEAYAAATSGREPSWKPLAASYADYSEWQRARLAAGEFQSDLDYWKKELQGAPCFAGDSVRHAASIGDDVCGRLRERATLRCGAQEN